MSGSETDKVLRWTKSDKGRGLEARHPGGVTYHNARETEWVLAEDHDARLSAAQGEIARLREALKASPDLLLALEMGSGALMLIVKNAADLLSKHPLQAATYCKEASEAAAVLKRHRAALTRGAP